MKVVLSSPRGFCAGVVRAIEAVELCLEKFGPPVYVKHQIVHNPYVVKSLEDKGAIVVFVGFPRQKRDAQGFCGARLSCHASSQQRNAQSEFTKCSCTSRMSTASLLSEGSLPVSRVAKS